MKVVRYLLSEVVREGDFVGCVERTASTAVVSLIKVSSVDEFGVLYESEVGYTSDAARAQPYSRVTMHGDGCTTVDFLTTLHCDFRREYEGFTQAMTEARRVAARELGGVAWSEYE